MDGSSSDLSDITPGRDSNCSLRSLATPTRRTPSLKGSAKFIRTSSSNSQHDDKAALAFRTLLNQRLLITQPGEGAEEEEDDDSEGFYHSIDGRYSRDGRYSTDGRYSRDGDYETDLEMDYEEWIAEDNNLIDDKASQEKKYIHTCNETGTIPVSYFLKHIENSHFRMRFHGLGPLGAKAISGPMKDNHTIESLDLQGNWMEKEGAEYISDMLKENLYLTEVNLAENRLGKDGAEALCDMLQRNDTLLSLNLSGNQLGDSGAENICTMLQKNSSLKRLLLSYNDFEDKAAFHFKEALSHNESLESLDLSWNHFRTQGAVAIAEGVQENYGLKSLNVAMNGFSGAGAEALGRALKHNRGLTELDVSHNRVPEEGAGHIALGLQTNDILKILKIGFNPLGAEGPMALLVAISKNDMSCLEYLDLSDVFVLKDFRDLQTRLERERVFTVTHAGVLMERQDFASIQRDSLESFRKDPYGKLRSYINDSGYRLMDLFREFDKDGSQTLTKDEFVRGLKNGGVQITMNEINILLQNLDVNQDGIVDYGELLQGDKKFRMALRKKDDESPDDRKIQDGMNRVSTKSSDVVQSILGS